MEYNQRSTNVVNSDCCYARQADRFSHQRYIHGHHYTKYDVLSSNTDRSICLPKDSPSFFSPFDCLLTNFVPSLDGRSTYVLCLYGEERLLQKSSRCSNNKWLYDTDALARSIAQFLYIHVLVESVQYQSQSRSHNKSMCCCCCTKDQQEMEDVHAQSTHSMECKYVVEKKAKAVRTCVLCRRLLPSLFAHTQTKTHAFAPPKAPM